MKFEDALARIETFVGTRYDESVVNAFAEACREGQIRPGVVKLRKPGTTTPPKPPTDTPQLAQVT
jgi:hypothetical protein